MRKLVLLDCDGVLADFVGSALDFIHLETGQRYTPSDVTEFDIFKALNCSELWDILPRVIESTDFVAHMEPYPEALHIMPQIQEKADVLIVTSPFDARNWSYDRAMWLKRWFNISKSQIVSTSAKWAVHGDIFVDDYGKNLVEWTNFPRNTNGQAILFSAPYNLEYSKQFKTIKSLKELLPLL